MEICNVGKIVTTHRDYIKALSESLERLREEGYEG
jgi:hypothetical protein